MLSDPRSPEQISKDQILASEYAKPGSVKAFCLRQGFMPHNEQDAEAILIRIIQEHEMLSKVR